jgi:protein SCO1/2
METSPYICGARTRVGFGCRYGQLIAVYLIVFALFCGFAPSLEAIERPENVLNQQVGIFTKLGTQVNLEARFTDTSGRTASLREFSPPGKPILIAPVYYKCPRLCGLLLDGVYTLLNEIPLQISKDFSVLVVGFDPTETPADASAVMAKFNARLKGDAALHASEIKFLVGDEASTAQLMSELGFKFMKDGKDFAHSAAVMILTPGGEISQYFTGISFPSWDVRLSLVEASRGNIGTAIDHLLLYCFRFDPLQGKYTWAVVGVLRVGGVLTLLGLAFVYYIFAFRKMRSKRAKVNSEIM